MILTIHILVGALVGVKIHNYWLIVLVALALHYLLDFVPHKEYSVSALKYPNFNQNYFRAATKVLSDLALGFALALWLLKDSPSFRYALVGMGSSLLPDGITMFYWSTKIPWLKPIVDFHCITIHYFKYKKIPLFWRSITQIIVFIITLFLLWQAK